MSRLRLLMDAWCALWMWTPANGTNLPTLNGWLDAAELLLGQPDSTHTGAMFTPHELDDGTLESVEMFGKATIAEVVDRHPWLGECRSISADQSFFHWELEFAPLFVSGGFDLQIGNPPWVRPTLVRLTIALAEHDPFFAITSTIPQEVRQQRRTAALADPAARRQYTSELAENEGLNALLGAVSREPLLEGLQNNLYLLFITNCWRRQSPKGIVTLLHPDGFSQRPPKQPTSGVRHTCGIAGTSISSTSCMLFQEISHTKEYGVHVYGSAQESPEFLQAAFLYHPSVVDRSLVHDGSGEVPGRKLAEGGWDLRPHAKRLVRVDGERLESWALLMDYDDALSAPVVKVVTSAEAAAVDAIAKYPRRFGTGRYFWSRRLPRAVRQEARSGGGTHRDTFGLERGPSPRAQYRGQHAVREAAPTVRAAPAGLRRMGLGTAPRERHPKNELATQGQPNDVRGGDSRMGRCPKHRPLPACRPNYVAFEHTQNGVRVPHAP